MMQSLLWTDGHNHRTDQLKWRATLIRTVGAGNKLLAPFDLSHFEDGGDDRQSSVMPISALRWFRTRTYDFVRWGACYNPASGTARPQEPRYGSCLSEQRHDGKMTLANIISPKKMTNDDRNSINYGISHNAVIPRSWSL